MEISLRMNENNRCKVNIADEKAKSIYGKLALLLHEAYLEDGIGVSLKSVPECAEKSMESSCVKIPYTRESDVALPARGWGKNRIVFYMCAECENLRYAFVPEGIKDFEAHCPCGCSAMLEDMREASYECPCCDFKGSVYVANGGTEVRCRDCKAIVDLPRAK